MYTNHKFSNAHKLKIKNEKLKIKNEWATMGMWVAYVWGTTLAGLAVHPYKSVKKMILSDRVLLPVVLSPALGLVTLFVVGRLGSGVFELQGYVREIVAFLLGTTLIGLVMWQGLLLALVYRFWRAR